MLDWKVSDDSHTPFPDEEIDNEVDRRPSSPKWFYLMVSVVVLLVAIAGGLVWGRLHQGERALEEDLLVQIRIEENARRFGQTNRLNVLIPNDVPQQWRERFASHFRTPSDEVRAVEVTIENLEIDGERATVWVRLGAQVQRRAYRMTSGGWRRVPLETGWEGENLSTEIPLGDKAISLYYNEVDQSFATQLAAGLPALLNAVQRWRETTPALVAMTIQPHELEPGVIDVYFQPEEWVSLNSPQVVQLPTHWNMSEAAAIRYTLAEQLLNQDPLPLEDPTLLESEDALPGVAPFLTAVRTVVALRWALPPDEYVRLVAYWQEQVPELAWQSPFFAERTPRFPDPFQAGRENAIPLLVAEAFITHLQPTATPDLLNRLRTSSNWDAFFQATTGYNTGELENLAGGPPPADLTFPLKVSTLLLEEYPHTGTLAVQPNDQRHPIIIEGLETLNLEMPQGAPWSSACTALFGELEIEGEWREEGRRLVASRMAVSQITLPARLISAPIPADTIAYLASGSDTLMPSAQGMNSIVALTATGERHHVLMNGESEPLRLALAPSPWMVESSQTGIFLTLDASTADCQGHWLLRFVPGTGITGAWLYRPAPSEMMIWDDISNRGLLIQTGIPTEDQIAYWWLDEGESAILGAPAGTLSTGTVRAIRPGSTHIAIQNESKPNNDQPVLSLIDLTGATEPRYYTSHSANASPTAVTFSPDGDYLYLAWTDSRFVENSGTGTELTRIDLTDGSSIQWWQPEDGAIYALLPHTTAPALYAIAYNLTSGLHLVRFDETERLVLAQNRQGSDIADVLPCGTGGLLYMTITSQEAEGSRPHPDSDLRDIFIVPPDAASADQTQRYPLQNWEYPVMCP